MLPTIDMSEPMQEAIPAFVGSDFAQVWSCCTTLPMTSAALTDALLSFSGAPFFVLVNMSTSYFRRYEGTMRDSADSSTRRQRYHVLSAAILSNGGNRNFVHMKVMVDAGYLAFPVRENRLRWRALPQLVQGSALKLRIPSIVPTKSESSMDGDRERHGLFRARPLQAVGSACPGARISIPQVIPPFYDAACEVHHEHFSRIADRRVKRPKIDLELLDRSYLDGSVSAWVGNGLKTR
jgi:hypothetical protein